MGDSDIRNGRGHELQPCCHPQRNRARGARPAGGGVRRRPLTYRELDQASGLLSAALTASGIEPGDRVALQLPNIPQFLISYFGILKAGGIVVPLNVLLRAPEVAFHLSDSGARVLITWDGVLAEAAKGAEVAGVETIYAVGRAGEF